MNFENHKKPQMTACAIIRYQVLQSNVNVHNIISIIFSLDGNVIWKERGILKITPIRGKTFDFSFNYFNRYLFPVFAKDLITSP